MRKWLYYNHFRMGVFFLKKFSRAEDCAEDYNKDNCSRINNYLLVTFVIEVFPDEDHCKSVKFAVGKQCLFKSF